MWSKGAEDILQNKTVEQAVSARKEEGMASNCDSCVNYVFDEEDECFYCLVNLDEDEMYRFLTGTQNACPYYQLDDEYAVVRHQI